MNFENRTGNVALGSPTNSRPQVQTAATGKQALGSGASAKAHVDGGASCASFTFLAIKTFVAAGSLRQGQEVFAGVRYGATHLTGDGATTQGAHRVHGGVWVRFRPGDPRYDAVRADGRRSPQSDGSILAALPAAALSRLGWKIAIEPIRAVTLLGTRFNQVNTFTETHGEKDAYSQLVQFAARSAPVPPKVVALDARALVIGHLLPASIRVTGDALLHYKGQLKKSGLSAGRKAAIEERLANAELSIDRMREIESNKIEIPAMSLACLQNTAEVLRAAEESAAKDGADSPASHAASTWVVRNVGGIDLSLPDSAGKSLIVPAESEVKKP